MPSNSPNILATARFTADEIHALEEFDDNVFATGFFRTEVEIPTSTESDKGTTYEMHFVRSTSPNQADVHAALQRCARGFLDYFSFDRENVAVANNREISKENFFIVLAEESGLMLDIPKRMIREPFFSLKYDLNDDISVYITPPQRIWGSENDVESTIRIRNNGQLDIANLRIEFVDATDPATNAPAIVESSEIGHGSVWEKRIVYRPQQQPPQMQRNLDVPAWSANKAQHLQLELNRGNKTEYFDLPIGYSQYQGINIAMHELGHLIDPNAEAVQYFAATARSYCSTDASDWNTLVAIDNAMKYNFRYSIDPGIGGKKQPIFLINHAQSPTETLIYGGDCEDLSILFASALLAVGLEARILVTAHHAQVLIGIEGDLPAGIPYHSIQNDDGSPSDKKWVIYDPSLRGIDRLNDDIRLTTEGWDKQPNDLILVASAPVIPSPLRYAHLITKPTLQELR